jgi:hypothetical protein
MIQLVDRGPNESIIRFTPRFKYKRLGSLECDLISGHHCTYCNNVIQALYYTNKPVDLEKYEETKVLSQGEKNEGELLKVVPNFDDEGNYKLETFNTAAGQAQRITLKNHVVNWAGASGSRKEYFERGERCCTYTSVISLREDLMMRDLATVAGYTLVNERLQKPDPTAAFIIDWINTEMIYVTRNLRVAKAIGIAPPAILIPRKVVDEQFVNVVSVLNSKWDKKVAEDLAAMETVSA